MSLMGSMRISESMDFSKALVKLRLGDKVSRYEWGYTGVFVVYQKGYPDGIPINANTAEATGIPQDTVCIFKPYLMIRTGTGAFVPWTPTQEDILAQDWVVSTWSLIPAKEETD